MEWEETKMDESKGHSEDYFKDYRDFWWNADYIDLLARRWGLDKYSTLLDVGCGCCHWSRLLAPYLAPPRKITAVDRDPKWAKGSRELIERFAAMDAVLEFRQGDACRLPFPDDSFDVVTCQTVLIHLADPLSAVTEMKRVMKSGGILICAEPVNIFGWAVCGSTLTRDEPLEDTFSRIKYSLIYERGKRLLGEGDNSLGDHVPGFFASAGLTGIQVYLSDKASPLFPPYDKPEQKALLQAYAEWLGEDGGAFDRAEALRYFKA
jgi:SAM-dependent methyltransferase